MIKGSDKVYDRSEWDKPVIKQSILLGDNNHQGKRVPIRLNDEECIELQGPAIPDAFKNFEKSS